MTEMIIYKEITTSEPLLMPSKDLFICFSDGVKPFQIQIITSGFLSICHYEKKNIVIFFLEILVDQTPIIV